MWTPHQALPMDPTILINIRNKLNLANPIHATFWAACLVSFFLLLRKSNVVVESAEKVDLSKQLCRQDLKWFQNCIQVTLRWSKTNQFGQKLTFSLPRIPGSLLCPYQAVWNVVVLVPASSGLCFVRPGGAPFTYYQYHSMLHSTLKSCGYPVHLFSSHSNVQRRNYLCLSMWSSN